MRTWDDYKEYVRRIDPDAGKEIDEAECLAAIISKMIEQRNILGLTQRQLAEMCDMPQSSVARIEALRTTPNIDTLLKIMKPLGLRLTVSKI